MSKFQLPYYHTRTPLPCRTVVCVRLLRLRLRRAPRAARARRRAPAAAREPRRAMGVASESVPCAGVWARCVRTHVDVCARVCVCRACAGVCASGGRASSTTPSSAARARESDRARFKESIYDYSKLCLNIFAHILAHFDEMCPGAVDVFH